MDIVEFLRARLDEDEAVARAAVVTTGVWVGEVNRDDTDHPEEITEAVVQESVDGSMDRFLAVTSFTRFRPLLSVGENVSDVSQWVSGPPEGPTGESQVTHIARHDPARVLREVEAKRRILYTCDTATRMWLHARTEEYADGVADPGDTILRALASVYADHPDYDPEWR